MAAPTADTMVSCSAALTVVLWAWCWGWQRVDKKAALLASNLAEQMAAHWAVQWGSNLAEHLGVQTVAGLVVW